MKGLMKFIIIYGIILLAGIDVILFINALTLWREGDLFRSILFGFFTACGVFMEVRLIILFFTDRRIAGTNES